MGSNPVHKLVCKKCKFPHFCKMHFISISSPTGTETILSSGFPYFHNLHLSSGGFSLRQRVGGWGPLVLGAPHVSVVWSWFRVPGSPTPRCGGFHPRGLATSAHFLSSSAILCHRRPRGSLSCSQFLSVLPMGTPDLASSQQKLPDILNLHRI